ASAGCDVASCASWDLASSPGGCDEMHDVTADRGRLAGRAGLDGRGPGGGANAANGAKLRHAYRPDAADAEARGLADPSRQQAVLGLNAARPQQQEQRPD